jgi:Flp pilus assembly CpaE family ATPase
VLAAAIESTRQQSEKHPSPALRYADLYTFLPAKPGVGTSAIAISASCALAEDIGARTLLMDCEDTS